MTGTDLRLRRTVRIGPLRLVLSRRVMLWYAAISIGIAVLLCCSIGIGEVSMPLGDVVAVLVGGGSRGDSFIVRELRLPRALVALGAGIALGVSGALIQCVTRNPLASPDVLGILSGASTGAVAAIVLGAASSGAAFAAWGATPFAILGACIAAAAVFLLSWSREASPMRLILVGIGVAAMCTACTSLLLVSARIHEASQALVWLTGTLEGRTWTHVWPLIATIAMVVPFLGPLLHPLGAVSLGDGIASSVGVDVRRIRLFALACATVLAAVAVAATGPIAFVAFVAPQLVMRLVGGAVPPVIGGGLTGALLLLATDVVTRSLLPVALPVGIVTVVLGAPFFLMLMMTRRRKLTA